MLKIFGYTLYMSGTWWFGYLLIYLPIVASIANALHKRWRPRNASRPLPWRLVGPILLVVLTFPLWDVLVTAVRAKPLCQKEAGIKVFKTVQADGIRNGDPLPELMAHGIRFTERDTGKDKRRETIKDGKIVEERIHEFTTRYSPGYLEDTVVSSAISRHGYTLVDTANNEILSQQIFFSVHRGWFETVVSGLLGLETNPWICGDTDSYRLVLKTINADSKNAETRQ